MRFAVALVTLLLAGVLIACGIAQRTVLRPPDHVSMSAEVPADARFVVVPGSVLRAHSGQQQLHIEGGDVAFAAYGTTADVSAWLAGEEYVELRLDADGAVAPVARTAPELTGLAAATNAPGDPDGSDLWLDQRREQGGIDWTVNVPASMSLLVAADGTAPAPSAVRLTWPVRTGTPFAVPLIAVGGSLGVVGLLLYVWALVQIRRRRGPRRRPPAKVARRPQPPMYRPVRPAAVPSNRGRRSVRRFAPLRPAALGGGLLAGAVLLTGCGSAAAPEPAGPAAAPPLTAAVAAVSEAQAGRIVERVALVAEQADGDRDADLLATRFAGPALELREAAYRIRKKDKKARMPEALPTDDAQLRLILPEVPEATSAWPRTLFAVVEDKVDTKAAALGLTLVQDDPWSDYRVHYAMALQKTLPDLPAATSGTKRLDASTPVLRVAPAELSDDYAVLLRKPKSAEAAAFDTTSDDLADGVGKAVKDKVKKRLGSTATIAFSTVKNDSADVVAMADADGGAIVSVHLEEKWTVKPKRSGVSVKPSGGTKILAKTASTTTGIASVYGYQLLFSVPSAGSDDPVVLLGYAQGLVSAKEL